MGFRIETVRRSEMRNRLQKTTKRLFRRSPHHRNRTQYSRNITHMRFFTSHGSPFDPAIQVFINKKMVHKKVVLDCLKS